MIPIADTADPVAIAGTLDFQTAGNALAGNEVEITITIDAIQATNMQNGGVEADWTRVGTIVVHA